MRKERIYFLLMKPFTKKTLNNFYKYGFYLLLALFISGIIFTSIKYPPKYPIHNLYPTTPYNPGVMITRGPVNNP